MVRLRVQTKATMLAAIQDFNSTMVRLRGTNYFYCTVINHLFQFHYGTIKSFHARIFYTFHVYFNSTMVRLRGLKIVLRSITVTYFNSTMVRLREGNKLNLISFDNGFQFHYGTIKSGLPLTV